MEKVGTKIIFYGGIGEVTGANFMIDDAISSLKILIDCGLFQGSKEMEEKNAEHFAYDPKDVDYLFVTHAHLDHVGRIPKLIHDGFRGKIYSTAPTKEIAEFVLNDSLGLLKKENDGQEMYFNEQDIRQAMSLWETVEYHQEISIGDIKVVARDAGHILGSTMYEFTRNGHKLVFTGDLGNSPSPLLPDTESLSGVNYLIMESVYGDRNHENRDDRHNLLEDVIEDTMRAGGTLMIPAFSVERTQEMLFEIENMMEHSRIPLAPVFLDSPLGIEVTDIYKKYASYLNETAREFIKTGDGIFKFPQLHQTLSTEQSKAIFQSNPRKIIIAGSGMSNGGRILHHEKHYLPDSKNTLLLVGYQEIGSTGRILQEGAKMVKIMGDEIPVNAKVVSIHGYSAHKDSDHLLEFVDQTSDTLKKVFVCMGEPRSSLFLVQRLRDYIGIDAIAPDLEQVVEIEF